MPDIVGSGSVLLSGSATVVGGTTPPVSEESCAVLTNIPYITKQFLDSVVIPNSDSIKAYIFDDELDYTKSLKKIRARNKKKGLDSEYIPLFSFKRTPLRYSDSYNMRSISKTPDTTVSGDLGNIYKSAHCMFDIEFLFISESMEQLEEFEICYMCRNGISEQKEITVNFPEIGEFRYDLTWGDLEGLQTTGAGEDQAKVLQGKVTVEGFFFTFNSTYPKLLLIRQELWDWDCRVIFGAEEITN